MGEAGPAIWIDAAPHQDVAILVVQGMLDSSTYRTVRDTVIKAALDEPRAVIVDVNRLSAPSTSAWSVFTSARWHVSVWPDVPIQLVCANSQTRRVIAAVGVTRYVPVHPTRESALDAVRGQSPPVRRRASTELPVTRIGVGLARARISDWLTGWGQRDLIPVAATVATVFVENVLDHTESAPVLIVESYRDTVTVAVEDCSDRLPGRHEDSQRGAEVVSGLAIVSALCRAWGAIPSSSGKTVWGLIGRENRL
ncbi:STAS domain-containing protein [Mycobacterium sp. 852002-51057_SCH5723018]|uniref:STAS domain-containing protein n=1 Tax=Mycobacterium sp. 852002-51057_SCH5723018 TaxID=1834094 RepID=UPI000801C2DB|nr:STAS domain-containing protein [Mycobacterium sp. 852002-51057_SCH5723018]OBG29724.1 sulfate transporter [Mycobacterium sp. 852002-51057_SCH5723018]